MRRKSLRETKLGNIQSMTQLARMYGDKPVGKAYLEEVTASIKPKRETGPRGSPEHDSQVAVIYWWRHQCVRYNLPEFALYAIPNGGARDEIVAARLKAEGVRRGIWDLFLAVPTSTYHGLFIEMKAGYNKLTDEQDLFGRYVAEKKYETAVCWSSEAAIDAIKRYLLTT